MSLHINHVRFLLIVFIMVVAVAMAGECFPVDSPVKQYSAERDSSTFDEVFHGDYGHWNPAPNIPKGNPAPVPHDFTPPPRRLKA
ncbi:unnamed protein product [Arabis nemorensis]|uniref:Uncharacterized protein n=1 Tax=Arabis nemorensis TaxID=586526 RepID=A0A565CHT6_9BRAS|nr:unnamed protein product [Arabis nemorensis]